MRTCWPWAMRSGVVKGISELHFLSGKAERITDLGGGLRGRVRPIHRRDAEGAEKKTDPPQMGHRCTPDERKARGRDAGAEESHVFSAISASPRWIRSWKRRV